MLFPDHPGVKLAAHWSFLLRFFKKPIGAHKGLEKALKEPWRPIRASRGPYGPIESHKGPPIILEGHGIPWGLQGAFEQFVGDP